MLRALLVSVFLTSSLAAETMVDGPIMRLGFTREVRELFENKAYAELDALEERLRLNKEQFPEGLWKLYFFSEAFTPSDTTDESAWQETFRKLKEWEAKNPASVAAPVAHAKTLVYYAWQARGNGSADTVTQERWTLYRERLQQARSILNQALKAHVVSPDWHYVMLKVALGQGWSREDYMGAFDEAVALEPAYYSNYAATCVYLLPRWHGTEGAWEAFILEQMNKLGTPEGQVAYARLTWTMVGFYKNVFKQSKVKWEYVKMGFEEMLRQFPDSEWNLQNYCKFAVMAGDKQTAQNLFNRLGNPMVIDVWGNMGYFNQCKKWASEP